MMGDKRMYRLVCDRCNGHCSEDWLPSVSEVIEDAAYQGWNVDSGDDLCPVCLAKRDAERADMNLIRMAQRRF
jgi:hypothetical protein